MHEMALCEGLMDLIRDEQAREGFERVRRVIVEVGVLGHVEPHALEFAFSVQRDGTIAADAVLEIREVPGQAWCMDCATTIELRRRGDPCPRCGGFVLIVQQGEELRVKELEVI